MNFNINFNNDSLESNWFIHLFQEFKKIPNTLILHNEYLGNEFLEIIGGEIINSLIEIIPSFDSDLMNQKSLYKIKDDIFISFIEVEKNKESFFITEVCFYYKDDKQLEEISVITSSLNEIVLENETHFSKFNTISITEGGLSLSPIEVKLGDIEPEEKYSPDLIKSIKKLKKKIKNTNKGLSIFYGERGTGKTEMAKHLINDLDKISVFIPSNSLELTLNNLEFKSLLERNKNIILLIDDCELFANYQLSKMNYITNNLVQLTDGIISDELNLHIILIFNESDYDNLDDNLIDSNNLLEIIEFDEIDVEMAKELSKTLGFNRKYKTKQRLVDIFKNKTGEIKNKIGL